MNNASTKTSKLKSDRLPLEIALEKIRGSANRWTQPSGPIPRSELPDFIDRVQRAAWAYYELCEADDRAASEIDRLDQLARRSSVNTESSFRSLSDDARGVVDPFGDLSRRIARIVAEAGTKASKRPKINDAVRRHLQQELGLSPRGRNSDRIKQAVSRPRAGRPEMALEEYLVSLVAAAFADATGRESTRSWSLSGKNGPADSDFERIIDDVFSNIGIDAAVSSKKAVQRHVKERREVKSLNSLIF